MNITNLLLATTSILILVAFILSFGNFKRDSSSDDSRKQREELILELAKIRAENNALREASLHQAPSPPVQIVPATSAPAAAPTPATTELSDEQARQIEELQNQLEEERENNEAATQKALQAEEETLYFMREKTREEQREKRKQNRIRIALKMGTVDTVNTEYGFITFNPVGGMIFQPGQKLGIRRQSGVLGQIKIDRQEGVQYVANLIPNPYAGGLPPVTIGDELIRLPDDYLTPDE